MEQEGSRILTILHLSDFHFKHGEPSDFDRQLVLDPLIEEIGRISNEADWRPEFVVCTGDIAYSGTPPDYEEAEKFLSRLLNIVGLGKDQLFVIPGNHDIDCAKLGTAHQVVANQFSCSSYDELRDKLLHLSIDYSGFLEVSNKLFDTEEVFRALLEKFWAYCDFTERIGRRFGEKPYAFC